MRIRTRWRVGSGDDLRRRLRWRVADAHAEHRGIACARLPGGMAVLVTGSLDHGRVRVWDLATGQPRGGPLARPQAADLDPPAVACEQLPDGTPVLVTAHSDGTIQVWDLVAGQLRREAAAGPPGRFPVLACTRLPDGTAIAVTGRFGGAVRCWDLATLRPYHEPLPGDWQWPIVACTRLADGTPVAVIGDGGALHVWDLVTGERRGDPLAVGFDLAALACVEPARVEPARVEPARVEPASAEPAGAAPLAVVGSHRQSDPDRAGRFGTVQAWDLASGRPHGPPVTGHGGEIESLAAIRLPDGAAVAVSVDRYGAVQPWDLATGHRHGPRLPHDGEAPEVACIQLPDGTPVVAVMADNDLRVWDLTVAATPEGLTGNLRLVGHTSSPDGHELVVTAGGEYRRGNRVQVWEAASGRRYGDPPADPGPVMACTRLPDGSPVLVTARHRTRERGAVRLWDLLAGSATDLVLAGLPGELDVLDCVVLRDGTPIIVTGDGPVRAWDAGTGRPYGAPLPVDAGWRRALSVMELPAGELVAVHIDSSGNLRAWDLRTGHPYGPRLAGPGGPVRDQVAEVAAGLLPDRTPVAVTASHDRHGGRIRVWDLARSAPRGEPLLFPTGRPLALACTRLADGTAVVAAGGGQPHRGAVQLWDLSTGAEIGTVGLPDLVAGLAFVTPHRLVVATELDVLACDLS